MKKIVLIFLFIIGTTISRSQTTDENQAVAMLKTFYTAYMSAFSNNDTKQFERTLIQLRRTYCTVKCEKKYKKLADETDSDPIINAQDSDAKRAKTLSVKRDLKKPNLYTVSYYNYEYRDDGKLHKETTAINLVVIKENGHFKIDSIL